MKKEFEIENLGKLVFNEDVVGRFKVFLNDQEQTKISKKSFKLTTNNGNTEYLYISGSDFKGLFFLYNGTKYEITRALEWWVYALSIFTLLIPFVFGNVAVLVPYGIYIVGGFIGGAIGGLFFGLSVFFSSWAKKWYFRLIIIIVCVALTFLICNLVGTAIVNAAK